MRKIFDYDCFLFDFDGLLVNTEAFHYRAYKEMCHRRGYNLDISFLEYYALATVDAEAPRRMVYGRFPKLLSEEPDWAVLYQEKKNILLELLEKEPVELLPGVAAFLKELEKRKKCSVCATHSLRGMVDMVIAKEPLLLTLSHWVTREDYEKPKPAPDAYLKAIELYTSPSDSLIGFEDAERGLLALRATRATPVLVNSLDSSLRDKWHKQGVLTVSSFEDLF